jgi:PAS domain S-box-containing protein
MTDLRAPILLADDKPANLLALQALLQSREHELVSVSSGEEAVRAVAARDFAVALLDLRMPDMSGIDAMRAIRRLRKESYPTPIMLVTALDVPPASLREAYSAGAIDFVQKPFDGVVLASKVALFVALYRARVEAAASEERFHGLIDAITDYAIYMLDAGGFVATWNSGAEAIKGYRREEILGRNFSVFYTPEDRAAGRPERILETVRCEGRFEEENWRVRKDGSRFWANVVITALRNQDGEITGFAKVTRDLTARRLGEENVRTLAAERTARITSESERTVAVVARGELERVNRMKDEFLATMSHELRTPLNAIQGWATMLRRDRSDPAKLERGLEVIDRNAKAQTRLIADLLDISRIMSGKLELNRTTTELLPMVVAAADVVRPAAEGKDVGLVVDLDPSIGSIVADADRLQQVLWNLLTNAIRFTPPGGKVTVLAERSPSGVVLRVRDTGVGLAPEHLEHIFDRFMQVDSTTTRSHGGLGLGLSIVRHIVEGHGGTVWAESEGPQRGSTFAVKIPIPAVSFSAAGESSRVGRPRLPQDPVEEAEMKGRTMELAGLTLLAIDDDADSLELVRTVLADAGAQVRTATSAREALGVLDAEGPFDAIVSDVGMPEVDGYALMRDLRRCAATADMPAIALTAYARVEDAELARRAGYQRHLTKPVDERRLIEIVLSTVAAR